MKTENEYAEQLIKMYSQLADDEFYAIQCAINDVQNTIEALQRIDEVTFIDEYYFDYYNNVLNILKEEV